MKRWVLLGLLVAASASGQTASSVPVLQGAALSMYPPIAKAAHITGKMIVRVTVKDGLVTQTDILSKLDPSGQRFLETPTVANLKTWRFAADLSTAFTVTYTYEISGEATDDPTNDRVEMLPSLDVNITARPVKPAVMYGLQGHTAPDTASHEAMHAQEAVNP